VVNNSETGEWYTDDGRRLYDRKRAVAVLLARGRSVVDAPAEAREAIHPVSAGDMTGDQLIAYLQSLPADVRALPVRLATCAGYCSESFAPAHTVDGGLLLLLTEVFVLPEGVPA
jgi:hypothetical protein